MGRLSVLTLVLMCFGIVPVAAQGSIGFGPQVGMYNARGADGISLMGGAALRMKFSEVLGIEGSINYREEEYGSGYLNVKSWPVMVTGLIYPIPVLYGAIGAGWYNTSIDYNLPPGSLGGLSTIASESSQQFGWHFGGGVELPLGSVAKLVGDIRYVFLNYDFKNFPGSNGVDSNFYVISASLLFGL